MGAALFRTLKFTVLLFGIVLLLLNSSAWAKNPHNVVHVVGDSLSDPGNLFALTGFWPPSPPYAQRSSNGPVWAEYLSAELGVPVDSRAVTGAFSGTFLYQGMPVANFNSVQDPPMIPNLPGVGEQIEGLLADFPEGLSPQALYVLWAGSNDFFLGLQEPGLLEQVLPQTLENLSEAVCQLGTAGARHFAIGNLPDIGQTPFALSLGPETAASFSQTISNFNSGLEQALQNLPAACAETLMVFDTFQILQTVTASPLQFGFSNVTEPCLTFDENQVPSICVAPDNYLYWDGVHPTTAAHAILADQFRAFFCGTGPHGPGLRGRPVEQPPAVWRGVCYGVR